MFVVVFVDCEIEVCSEELFVDGVYVVVCFLCLVGWVL